MAPDQILLRGLDLPTRIGVPEEERASWQTLMADVTLGCRGRFEDCADDIAQTIDYAAVAARLRELAAARPRRLLETLAGEMAACLLADFGASTVVIELRKRVLPGTEHVAVRLERGDNL